MMTERKTRILFVDGDEISFQVRQCIARVLANIPPIELLHAHDGNEALRVMEKQSPDVIVFDEEMNDDFKMVLDYIPEGHVPVLVQSNEEGLSEGEHKKGAVTAIRKNDSLDGLHYSLLVAIKLALQSVVAKENPVMH